jgi:pimeloyl-ACP methyl ester carboxylesterase
MATGLSPEHKHPTGWWRRSYLTAVAPLAQHFSVYVVNRRPGLASGITMGDIAADYADAIGEDLHGPVLLHGVSTGGAVALQLAVDHPDLVRRLVLAPGACRLSPKGRRAQEDLARHTRAGNSRAGWAAVMGLLAPKPALTAAASGIGWLAGPMMAADDPSDLLATIAAEDAFDAEPRLGDVRAPTLVLGGTDDPFYSADLFRRTALGIPQAQLHLFPGKGHMYVATHPHPMAISLGFLLASR